jgi:hypothetical protein
MEPNTNENSQDTDDPQDDALDGLDAADITDALTDGAGDDADQGDDTDAAADDASGATSDDTDQWGNPVGTLYDADGNPVAPVEPPSAPPAPSAAPKPVGEPSAASSGPRVAPVLSAEREAALRERLGDLYDDFNELAAGHARHYVQAGSVANAGLYTLAATEPEFFKQYGDAIRQNVATQPPDVQAQDIEGLALVAAVMSEKQAGHSTFEAVRRVVAALGKKTPPAAAAPASKPTLRPTQKTPSGGVNGAMASRAPASKKDLYLSFADDDAAIERAVARDLGRKRRVG